MKISLKTFLLSMCAVGATVGVMTWLFIESPEMFLSVIRTGAAVGPFLLAVATIIWIGLRRTPLNKRLVAWGCTLLLAPVFALSMLELLLPTGNPLRMLSTQRLIAKRLPSQVDEPWVWRELEQRLADGDLTNAEVDSAVAELTAYMTRTSPTGWNSPLSWQRDFLRSAIQNGKLTAPMHMALCEAFFGANPRVKLPTTALHADDTRFNVDVEYGNHWANNSGLGVELVWDQANPGGWCSG